MILDRVLPHQKKSRDGNVNEPQLWIPDERKVIRLPVKSELESGTLSWNGLCSKFEVPL
jgi:hypothetical protein